MYIASWYRSLTSCSMTAIFNNSQSVKAKLFFRKWGQRICQGKMSLVKTSWTNLLASTDVYLIATSKLSDVEEVSQNTALFRSIWVAVASDLLKLNSVLSHLWRSVKKRHLCI